MEYKKPLNILEQLDYLVKNKNLKVLDKDNAILSLKKCGYINLITPFKHKFAIIEPNNPYRCIKNSQGKHIYHKQSEFLEYVDCFLEERNDYSQLYSGIHKFETIYKSLVINHFLVKHNIKSSTIAIKILRDYRNRVDKLVIHSEGGVQSRKVRRSNMKNVLDVIIERVSGQTIRTSNIPSNAKKRLPLNIYIVLNRMTLTETNTLYYCMKKSDRLLIYNEMSQLNVNLGAKDHTDFLKRIFNLVSIRNTIMHFNSITILLKYSNYTKKIYRPRASIENYKSIIRSLKFISENVELAN